MLQLLLDRCQLRLLHPLRALRLLRLGRAWSSLQPKKTWLAPPGGASTRLDGRSLRKLPTCRRSARLQCFGVRGPSPHQRAAVPRAEESRSEIGWTETDGQLHEQKPVKCGQLRAACHILVRRARRHRPRTRRKHQHSPGEADNDDATARHRQSATHVLALRAVVVVDRGAASAAHAVATEEAGLGLQRVDTQSVTFHQGRPS